MPVCACLTYVQRSYILIEIEIISTFIFVGWVCVGVCSLHSVEQRALYILCTTYVQHRSCGRVRIMLPEMKMVPPSQNGILNASAECLFDAWSVCSSICAYLDRHHAQTKHRTRDLFEPSTAYKYNEHISDLPHTHTHTPTSADNCLCVAKFNGMYRVDKQHNQQ